MPKGPMITREALRTGKIEELLRETRNGLSTMSDTQRAQLVHDTLESLPDNASLWVFGYGSLIWNPAIDFDTQRRCRITGFERKFCFWTTFSRGTQEQPGLMMGLVEGEQCEGVAFQIHRNKAATELDILFRREMVTYVYIPTWVTAHCVDTGASFTALTFVVDTRSERYTDKLSQKETISTLATAAGPLGRNCDYLFDLSKKLRELEFHDPELEELERQVKRYQARQSYPNGNNLPPVSNC
ncbi:MAG: gamma-glutamylcyclotransferase [Granulosicoccus sp.]